MQESKDLMMYPQILWKIQMWIWKWKQQKKELGVHSLAHNT